MNNYLYVINFILLIAGLAVSRTSILCQSNSDIDKYHEYQDDPYLPPDFKKQKFTKSFQLQSDNFFCTQVNVDASGRNITGDAANEPTIAINPLNPDEIIIAWRQFDNVQSNFRQAGCAFSVDGGKTWNNNGPIEPGIFRSDPVLAADGRGRFYLNSLRLLNDEIVNDIFKSEIPGIWDAGTYAFGGDKQWMIVEQSNVDIPNIYAYWSLNPNICPGEFIRSVDGGVTLDSCENVGTEIMSHGTLAIGPNRELYVTGKRGSNYYVTRSLNAYVKEDKIIWEVPARPYLDGKEARSKGPNPAGLLGQVEIDVDKSEGTNNGNVYVLSSVERFDKKDVCDVMFTRSIDGGNTFEAPIRINTDTDSTAWQWFGTMSVAPNGRIDVVWLDTREDPGGYESSLYYSYSENGGVTWSENQKLSPSFDPHVGWPNQRKMGDYFDMISTDAGAHLAWAATFNGEQDVYYGFITPLLTTSIDKVMPLNEILDVQIFPNPSHQFPEIRIVSKDKLELIIEITDQNGQLISSQILNVDSEELRDMNDLLYPSSGLTQGLYFLIVRSAQYGSQVWKFVLLSD